MLAPTPREHLVDPQERPYFLWDMEMTLDEFERIVGDRTAAARPYLVGKAMRQAKPDDLCSAAEPRLRESIWHIARRAIWICSGVTAMMSARSREPSNSDSGRRA